MTKFFSQKNISHFFINSMWFHLLKISSFTVKLNLNQCQFNFRYECSNRGGTLKFNSITLKKYMLIRCCFISPKSPFSPHECLKICLGKSAIKIANCYYFIVLIFEVIFCCSLMQTK